MYVYYYYYFNNVSIIVQYQATNCSVIFQKATKYFLTLGQNTLQLVVDGMANSVILQRFIIKDLVKQQCAGILKSDSQVRPH